MGNQEAHITSNNIISRWDDLRTEMKEQGYLRIKGLNQREDTLSARRGDYKLTNDCKHGYSG